MFKINNEIKAIKKMNQDCKECLELFIEKHKSEFNYMILKLTKNDIDKMLRIINL